MRALDLLPDGTFAVRDGQREWRTRRPNIGEWRTIVEAIQTVDARANEIEAIADEAQRVRERGDFLYGVGDVLPPYLTVMAQILSTLGDGPVEPSSLPVWCASGRPFPQILGHWRAVPLDLSSPTTVPSSAEEEQTASLSLAI